jgi:hypothetical protein
MPEQLGEDVRFKLRRLMESREKRDLTKAEATAAEEEYRETEAEAWQALDDSPLEGSIKVDLGAPYGVVTFGPRETYYGRILDKDLALDHFEQRAMVEEMTEPKFAMARVHEAVRDCLDAGQQLPPGLDFYAKRYVSITRKKG